MITVSIFNIFGSVAQTEKRTDKENDLNVVNTLDVGVTLDFLQQNS